MDMRMVRRDMLSGLTETKTSCDECMVRTVLFYM